MSQFSGFIMKYGENQIVCIFVEHEPRRAEGIHEIVHHVDITGRRIAFCQEKRLLAAFTHSHINHHDSVSVSLSIPCRIDEHIARLHVL